jgi:hypothetical protein
MIVSRAFDASRSRDLTRRRKTGTSTDRHVAHPCGRPAPVV